MTDPKTSNRAMLLLSRMVLPSKAVPTEKALLKSITDVAGPTSAEQFESLKQELVTSGCAHRPETPGKKKSKVGPFQITEAGRAVALAFLGVESLPPKTTWAKLAAEFIFPATVPADRRTIAADKTRVTAYLLADALGVDPAGDVKGVIQRAVMRDLGHPEAKNWDDLVRRVMSKRLGVDLPEMKLAEVVKQAPRLVFDMPDVKPDKLRLKRVREWATKGFPASADPVAAEVPVAEPADDLPAFAASVQALAATTHEGRFGDNKVFISSLYDHWTGDRPDLGEFKARLVEAHRRRLLTLSRADLVGAMDGDALRRSETRYLNAEFHFVLIEPGEQS